MRPVTMLWKVLKSVRRDERKGQENAPDDTGGGDSRRNGAVSCDTAKDYPSQVTGGADNATHEAIDVRVDGGKKSVFEI